MPMTWQPQRKMFVAPGRTPATSDDSDRTRGLGLIRTFDDQNLLATGLVQAQFACDDASVVAVVGHLSGRVTDLVRQIYVNNQMPVLVPVSAYDRITAHASGNVVRLTVKDLTEGLLCDALGRCVFERASPSEGVP
jgi:hypothetical protein